MAKKLTWKQYYDIGRRYSVELEGVCTCEEIAVELGCTQKKIYHESLTALGKFVVALGERHQLKIRC